MIDLLFVAWNRLEFTRKALTTLVANTHWRHVRKLILYDDGSTDGTLAYLAAEAPLLNAELRQTPRIGPVAIMNDYLAREPNDVVFAKIDNDVLLPPRWLETCLGVLQDSPEVDLLGLEAMYAVAENPAQCCARAAVHVGGIGLFRRRAFDRCQPTPRGRFGFTGWQEAHENIRKAWLHPSLPVCLLNLVPFDPWASLAKQYEASGWTRTPAWPPPYTEDRKELWSWWA